jgi:ferric-dicitrate binding protein FerR (iron transport regulator)
MNKHYFIKLLQRYQQGNLTNEEQQFLISYYNLFENEPDVFEMLSAEQKEEFKNNIQESIWRHILKNGQVDTKIKFNNRRYVKMTAAAVVFLIFFASLFYLFDAPSKNQEPATIAAVQKENRVIFLPDGSKVVLSAGSELNYPSSFDGLKNREVYLVGQAYFDIRHNSSMPFIVHTDRLATVVLGTAFNIKAIAGQEDITVTVTRGKVKVIDQDKNKTLGVITPNQQITYSKVKTNSIVKAVDSESVLGWKQEDLLCENLTIAEAAELLEEQYKMKIIINDQSIQSQRFTATFSKGESFEHVIKSICEFNGLVYEYDKKDSTVMISNKLIK